MLILSPGEAHDCTAFDALMAEREATVVLPSVSIVALDADRAEGSGGGATEFSFVVSRTGDTSAASTVSWTVDTSGIVLPAVVGIGFAKPGDFVGGVFPSGSLDFAAGDTAPKTVKLQVSADSLVEDDALFAVRLSSPTGAVLGTESALGTIRNDDTPTLTYVVDALGSVAEDAGTTTFKVVRSGEDLTAKTVYASTLQGQSAGYSPNGGDYVGLLNTAIKFAAGQTSQTVTVGILDDSHIESDETFGFIVQLHPTDPISTFLAKHDWTILDNDTASMPRLSIAQLDAIKPEGDVGSSAFTFSVTRSGDTTAASSVIWTVAGSGANPADAADFAGSEMPSNVVEFAAGETSKTVTVLVAGDTTAELDEGFAVTLFNPTGATIDVSTAQGTVLSEDTTGLAIAAADASLQEGAAGATTTFTFTVTRSDTSLGAISFDYAVTPGTLRPADGADFVGGVLPSGKVGFPADATQATVTIPVQGDDAQEPNEIFTVTLGGAPAGATLATPSANGTILADEPILDLVGQVTNGGGPLPGSPVYFSGPVAGVDKELVTITSENLNIAVGGPNWFIRSGSGNDAIAAHSGRNILDGSTGSNFLSGGTGTDTFFLDARDTSQPIWSTVLGFDPGDGVTIWGVTDATHTLRWVDDEGAEGFKGLTLHATAPSKPATSLTLFGFTTADFAPGGRLAVFPNNFEPVSGSNYMYVHGL